MHWPGWLGTYYRSAYQGAQQLAHLQATHGDLSSLASEVKQAAAAWAAAPQIGGLHLVFNALAFLIVMILTWILVLGIRESAWFNAIMVGIKLVIVFFFLVVGAFYIQPENWTPFPPHGLKGIAS